MWGTIAIALSLMWMVLTSCVYYEEFRQRKADADIRQETAELMRQQPHCLEKYEGDAMKTREHCAPYADALRRVNPRQMDGGMR